MRELLRSAACLIPSAIMIATVCNGCGPCDRMPPYAEKVSHRPHTYRMAFARGCPSLRPHVLRVWAYDYLPSSDIPMFATARPSNNPDMRICWEIIARRPIRADGFEMTIGEVPEGFEQMVPFEKPFAPQPGEKYVFGVETDWPCCQIHGVDSDFLKYAETAHAKED